MRTPFARCHWNLYFCGSHFSRLELSDKRCCRCSHNVQMVRQCVHKLTTIPSQNASYVYRSHLVKLVSLISRVIYQMNYLRFPPRLIVCLYYHVYCHVVLLEVSEQLLGESEMDGPLLHCI